MANTFLCPYCKNHLDIEDKIILSFRSETGKEGMVALSPQIGNYKAVYHKDATPMEGKQLKIFCPVCHANLTAVDVNDHLARLFMMDENKKVHEIYFSDIVGEHCTYMVKDHKLENSFGEDCDKYMNFWGTSPNY